MRIFARGFLLVASGAAFLLLRGDALSSRTGCGCPINRDLLIAGRVLSAADDRPIAGATVFYRGIDDVSDRQVKSINLQSLHGEVKTGPDGSYKIPDLHGGMYYVRVVAHGYFGGRRMLTGHRAGEDLRSYPDPVFHLLRDTLHLTVMSEAARIGFSFPRGDYNNRSYGASAFSADGDSFVFIAEHDRGEVRKEPQRACILWRIVLHSGDLARVNDRLPEKFCGSDLRIAVDGDSVLAYVPNEGFPEKPEAFRIHDVKVDPLPVADLPSELKEGWTPRLVPLNSEADDDEILLSETTADGRFTINLFQDDRTIDRKCERLMEVLEDEKWNGTIKACDSTYLPTYLFDRSRDRVYGLVSNSRGGRPTAFEYRYPEIAEANLLSRSYRTFTLPQFSYVQLLAFHPEPDGGTRLAYSAKGECDEPSIDSPQTQGDPVIGPERPSICFITLPPEEANSSAPH